MTIFKHEMNQNRNMLLIWTFTIAALIFFIIMFYPEMDKSMEDFEAIFANLGEFSKMFGLDQLSMGTLIGFYGMEVGNILGLGGGIFATIIGIGALAKEEDEHTAEFLFSHPIKRGSVVLQKYLAILVQIIILNVVVVLVALLGAMVIEDSYPMSEFIKYHLASFIMQVQIATMAFGISSFLKRNSYGLGIGIAIILYFLNLISKLSDKVNFFKYITPFNYADAGNVISSNSIDIPLVIIGLSIALVLLALGFINYQKKDLAS